MSLAEFWPDILSGIYITLMLWVLSMGVAFSGALLLVWGQIKGPCWLKAGLNTWIFCVRGTPLLAQLFLMYYGLGEIKALAHTGLWRLLSDPFYCAWLCLSLNASAYCSVIFKGIYDNFPKSDRLAAQSLGLSPWQSFRHIILPKGTMLAWPMIGNEMIMGLKGTALVSSITLMDLTGVAGEMIGLTYEPFLPLLGSALIYLSLSALLLSGFKWIEKRFPHPLVL